MIGEDDIVGCKLFGRKSPSFLKLVAEHRNGQIIIWARSELALDGRLSGSWIVSVPSPDESSVSAGIVVRQKVLYRPTQALLGERNAKVLKGLPPKRVQGIARSHR
jgi:hypothetical protein